MESFADGDRATLKDLLAPPVYAAFDAAIAAAASKKQADAHAENQYEQFSAQRRALLEAEGADASVRALEDAAKALPKPGKSSRKRK